jgi:hypothetical protein
MPNQLAVPFKKSYHAPIQRAARDYLADHTDYHPDEFKWDLDQWDSLRKAAVAQVVHADRVSDILWCVSAQFEGSARQMANSNSTTLFQVTKPS